MKHLVNAEKKPKIPLGVQILVCGNSLPVLVFVPLRLPRGSALVRRYALGYLMTRTLFWKLEYFVLLRNSFSNC